MKNDSPQKPGAASLLIVLSLVMAGSVGCGEVRGRRLIQNANQLYRDGAYPEAVELFRQAEALVPDLPTLWLNKGYTCRQMLIPGAKTPENDAAAKCALEAFERLQKLKPDDRRGPALYEQTLFETDQFNELAKLYEARVQKNPRDEDAVSGLIQVYSKMPDKTEQTLEWYEKKAALKPEDAEAQYSVGVFLWQQLRAKGGGNDKNAFDPRPDPNAKKGEVKELPVFAPTDIAGARRIELADKGLRYLEKAVELRATYVEAMAYLNLLHLQKAFGYFDRPDEWQKNVDKAVDWSNKVLIAQGKPLPKKEEPAESSKDGAAAKGPSETKKPK